MRYYEMRQEARQEFSRVLVASLLGSAERDAARDRRIRWPFRRQRSQKRVQELRLVLASLSPGSPVPLNRRRRVVLFRVVTAAWLLALAVMVSAIATQGIDDASGAADVAMVVATAVWFGVWFLAVPSEKDHEQRVNGPE